MSHRSLSILLTLPALIGSFCWPAAAQSISDRSVFAKPASDESVSQQSASKLAPELPLQANQTRRATYQVDFRVSIAAPAGTKRLRVWLPLPPSDACQQISNRTLATFPRRVDPTISTESEFGNTFAYFQFDSPDGAQLITHQFQATVHQLDWNVDYNKVWQPPSWPESFEPYQRPDPRADPRAEQSGELRGVLAQLQPAQKLADQSVGEQSSSRLMGAIRWVDKNVTYDHSVASLSADPSHALKHRRGHCSDYHGLCGTLARKIGYPSRVVYGLQMFDKASPSHCKLEVFLPPYGWVRFDLSETQKLALKKQGSADKIRDRTLRGFSENTWLSVTRGVNYELAPRASKSVAVVRTIYAEADGKPLPEPDPSAAQQQTFAWITMHRVDEVGDQSKPFQELE